MRSYFELSVAVIVTCLQPTRQVWRELVPEIGKRLGYGPSIHAPPSRDLSLPSSLVSAP
ncbi:uncharacterized protein LY79DRAFT_574016 [Colletotrichum navitas]|uniref:Uncharacterized protein n=1 Tax=Colletotrichum navitas TaxID=681940 RepID=A0AAD8PIV0_9PEZI|nr:uncharacterized protein LY79DRAFT_574016 [Colletotrichum navitas]KAK1561638.1 hypothetical protein LY79DRAFT_574016 [Colletotrichum navitas]